MTVATGIQDRAARIARSHSSSAGPSSVSHSWCVRSSSTQWRFPWRQDAHTLALLALRQDEVQINKNALCGNPNAVVQAMQPLTRTKKSDVVYDVGCGEGRILFEGANLWRASSRYRSLTRNASAGPDACTTTSARPYPLTSFCADHRDKGAIRISRAAINRRKGAAFQCHRASDRGLDAQQIVEAFAIGPDRSHASDTGQDSA